MSNYKIEIQIRNKNDGLWTTVNQLLDYQVEVLKAEKQFLWWKYQTYENKYTNISLSDLRKKSLNIALQIQNIGEIRLVQCRKAIDEDCMAWYPNDWKKVIWQDGKWL